MYQSIATVDKDGFEHFCSSTKAKEQSKNILQYQAPPDPYVPSLPC